MQSGIKMPRAIIAVTAIVLGSPVVMFAQALRYDLLLKGGHVIDPANHIDEVRDVAIFQGKIAAVEKTFRLARPERLWMSRSSTSRPG